MNNYVVKQIPAALRGVFKLAERARYTVHGVRLQDVVDGRGRRVFVQLPPCYTSTGMCHDFDGNVTATLVFSDPGAAREVERFLAALERLLPEARPSSAVAVRRCHSTNARGELELRLRNPRPETVQGFASADEPCATEPVAGDDIVVLACADHVWSSDRSAGVDVQIHQYVLCKTWFARPGRRCCLAVDAPGPPPPLPPPGRGPPPRPPPPPPAAPAPKQRQQARQQARQQWTPSLKDILLAKSALRPGARPQKVDEEAAAIHRAAAPSPSPSSSHASPAMASTTAEAPGRDRPSSPERK